MNKGPERIIDISPGTELNYGLSEDSDSVVVVEPVQAVVIGDGQVTEGAVPVRIIENGQPSDQVFYFHQPPDVTKI